MTSEVYFTTEARNSLRKLHIDVQRDIKRAVKKLAKDESLGKPLAEPLIGLNTLKVGNYRVVYAFEEGRLIIVTLGHRRDVYDTL